MATPLRPHPSRRRPLYVPVGIVLVAVAAAIVGWPDSAAPLRAPVPASALPPPAAHAGGAAARPVEPASISPFMALTCRRGDGESVNTSACNPDDGVWKGLQDGRPEVRAESAQALIAQGEFERTPVLASALHECALIQLQPAGQQGVAGCEAARVERSIESALASSHAQALRGDHIARDAYVDLLLTQIMAAQNQLEGFDRASSDPAARDNMERLRDHIHDARARIVSFVKTLDAPSERLLGMVQTVGDLVEQPK